MDAMTLIKHFLILLIIGVVIAVGVAYSGWYNPSTFGAHNPIADWYLKTVRMRGIDHRIADIKAPNLDDPALIKEGAGHYSEMCAQCHLAPGMTESEIRLGLNPKPPALTKVGARMDARRVFWAVKYGIGYTAMPAWGPSHDDQKIWAITAFVKHLPSLTPEQYKAMTAGFKDDD